MTQTALKAIRMKSFRPKKRYRSKGNNIFGKKKKLCVHSHCLSDPKNGRFWMEIKKKIGSAPLTPRCSSWSLKDVGKYAYVEIVL